MRLIEDVRPGPDPDELAALLGKSRRSDYSQGVRRRLRSMEARLEQLVQARLGYRLEAVTSTADGEVILESGIRFRSSNLARALKGCRKAVVFSGTIGSRIEREIDRLMGENRLSEGYILDAMGSATVESLADLFQYRMAREAKNGSGGTTLRFSPGYCDWPILDQRKIFAVLDGEAIGVALSESCLMTPRKSISGVFGLLPPGAGKEAVFHPCRHCRKSNCRTRRN